MSLGLSAFAAAAILLVARAADDGTAVRGVPWGIIMMVCGVSVLIAVLEKTGGMDLFTSLLARLGVAVVHQRRHRVRDRSDFDLQQHVGGRAAGVPADHPEPRRALGGGDPLAIALSINVGSSLVDVSPLSTIGALAVAAVTEPVRRNRACSSGS